eukprot:scaffold8266_cov97-Cylindrotheca_fusiformis.AAC.5
MAESSSEILIGKGVTATRFGQSTTYCIPIDKRTHKKDMHSPGIEPGTSAWKADILPLNYEC